MTPELRVHSFDDPRPRRAPVSFHAVDADGAASTRRFERATLVVALKSSCDGCREFVESELEGLEGLDLVLIIASIDEAHEWRNARRPVVSSPELWEALDLRSAPFYVLVDPTRERVVTEGVVFSSTQVATEIARFLTS